MSNPAPENPDHTPASAGSDQRQGAFITGGEFHGPFVGYQDNRTTYTEEQAYTVAGLPNPYLGLRAFTAADRDIFAGRERMVQALVQRLAAEDGDRLLFLVGASGSGKSSLARAGLLPALEARLREQGQAVETHILDRPGRTLITSLAAMQSASPAPATTLLLIDQFEELWSQGGPDEAQQVLDLLLELATQRDQPLRIVATLRSDFLPQLVADARFETYERCKVVVRVMSVNELTDAIQRPVQVRYPDKRLEPVLIERLAQDAAQDAAYLPLLQVTLEDLWRGSSLRLAVYTGLADAIQRRAEMVYAYRDHDTLQQALRTSEEQQIMLGLLLDLVRVSPGDEQRETRWRRTRAELSQKDPQRERLIADLTAARLLRSDRETEADGRNVETVDLIHEALLSRWERLKQAIEAERERLRQRERFMLTLHEWQARRVDDYLLSGVRLSEAEALRECGDSVFHEPDARLFYEHSVRRRDQERQRQIRRTRMVITALSVLTVLALLAAAAAGWFGIESRNSASTAVAERQRAENQLRVAESRRLAADAADLLVKSEDSERALLLAIESVREDSNPSARQTLQQAVAERPYNVQSFSGHTSQVTSAVFSPNGTHILTASDDGKVHLWNRDGTLLTSFQGHTGSVNSAVFSPDGTHILTASWDNTARLWKLDGSLLTSFQGHTGPVNSAVFSPDGTHVLTTSDYEAARLWKLDGSLLTSFQGHTDPVNSAVFSPDGTHILTASEDRTARLWKLDGSFLTSFQGHTRSVNSAVFSPDGTYILTVSLDNTARLWSLDGSLLTSFQGHTGPVNSAVFSPDGTHILTTSGDGTAHLWKLDGSLLTSFQGHTGPVNIIVPSAVFSSDGTHILAASQDGTVRLWKLDGSLLTSFQGHTGPVNSAVFSPDGTHILTTSWDNTARLWKLDGSLLTSFQGHTGPVNSAVFSPDGTHILTASGDGTARLWNLDGSLLTFFQGHTRSVNSAVFSSDGTHILTASDDGTARLWSLDGSLLTSFQGHTDWVLKAVFSPDGSHILTTSGDGTARLWNLDGTFLTSFQGHTNWVFIAVLTAVFSPDGKHILTASLDGTTRLWNLDGSLLASFQDHTSRVNSAVFSPDGSHILTTSSNGTAHLWSLDGTLLTSFQGHTNSASSAVFSPDETHILTASDDGTARLWNLDGTLLTSFQGHTNRASSAVFSPDGTQILTASWDNTARLWKLDGTLLASFQGHTRIANSALFSPDGKHILTASQDGVARLWPVKLEDWLLAAKCRVGRVLTAQEIRDYQVPTPLHFDAATLAQRQCPPVYSWER